MSDPHEKAGELLRLWEGSEWRETLIGWRRKPWGDGRTYPYAEIIREEDNSYSVEVLVYNKRLYPGFVKSWTSWGILNLETAKKQCDLAVRKSCTQLFTGVMACT